MTDEDVLHLLASSKEFSAIKVREEEVNEIEKLRKKYVPLKIKGGMESATGKQNLLLQVYISNGIIDTPTLISDSYFIQQSAGRICRALFEMVLKRGKAFLAAKFLTFAQMIEKKIWHFQTPLRQFLVNSNASASAGGKSAGGDSHHGGLLKMPTIMRLEERNLKLDQLIDMDAREIGQILKHDTMGHTVKQCLGYIPYLAVSATIQPITRSVLKIDMQLTAEVCACACATRGLATQRRCGRNGELGECAMERSGAQCLSFLWRSFCVLLFFSFFRFLSFSLSFFLSVHLVRQAARHGGEFLDLDRGHEQRAHLPLGEFPASQAPDQRRAQADVHHPDLRAATCAILHKDCV